MYFIGYDIGSSSVKASLFDAKKGISVYSCHYPKVEMKINAPKPGFAEQNPDEWWKNVKLATKELLTKSKIKANKIEGVGISYQMHGLVTLDKDSKVVRPAIIWCDSRAIESGEQIVNVIGKQRSFDHLLNAPGNFTLSKLYWIKNHEPKNFERIKRIMLPGDYIAFKLSGIIQTTPGGLSEGMLWDFKNNTPANWILDELQIDHSLIPPVVSNVGIQSTLSAAASKEIGLPAGIKIAYRAGDQPNNAFSLNVLNDGEAAATAGTSAVVYGVSKFGEADLSQRTNAFAHVNHSSTDPHFGTLLCINSSGIANSWLRKLVGPKLKYNNMNALAAKSKIGSNGVVFIPFGNGSERMLNNLQPGASFNNLNFNIHNNNDVIRSVQEGVAFALAYGCEKMNAKINLFKAPNANLFLSPVFAKTFASVTGCTVHLYNTDGAEGAARAAAIGTGFYKNNKEAFAKLKIKKSIAPDLKNRAQYLTAYKNWKNILEKSI